MPFASVRLLDVRAPRRTEFLPALAEVATAFGAAALVLLLSRRVEVDPLDRTGQVSGLAGLGLRFVIVGLAVLALVAVSRWSTAHVRRTVARCAFAAVAGLSTGLVAGGIALALRGTAWPLYGNFGDSGALIDWADDILAGNPAPTDYPPVILHVIAWVSSVADISTAESLQSIQIVGTAIFGPLAYLAWRLILSPAWALAVTLIAALPLLEPYKPITNVVLVLLVPLLIGFFSVLRRAAGLAWPLVAVFAASFGAAFGLLFLTYSGWFVWSAPGALVALGVMFPWRPAAMRGLALVAATAAVSFAVASRHVLGLLGAADDTKDTYFYFDTFVEPTYIAMWRDGQPGAVGVWPPAGELAGVGLFTLLLVVGLGIAIALAGSGTAVLTLTLLAAGGWVMRFHFAARMYEDQAVQLYPRTTQYLLFLLLVLCVLAVRAVAARITEWPSGSLTMGVLAAAMLLALSMGSSVSDKYLPRDDGTKAIFSYVAQYLRQPDGSCSTYGDGCVATFDEILALNDAPAG